MLCCYFWWLDDEATRIASMSTEPVSWFDHVTTRDNRRKKRGFLHDWV
jgi:hypothetical protein